MKSVDGPSANGASVGTIAVTGSKGGVGKSNLVLNLALALARWDRKVLLVDGDLGLANLDVLLGLVPKHTVEHLVLGQVGLDDVLLEGPGGIRLLPAASGVPNLTTLDVHTRGVLVSALCEAGKSVDTVLVDTGAGLGQANLLLQRAASRVLLVTTPEPTSMVDAYATLKVIWSGSPDKPVDLVVNAAVDADDADRVREQLSRAARHFLGREPGWLGAVYQDPRVPEAVRRQRPVLDLFPDCRASECYERIALKLAANRESTDSPMDYWRRLDGDVEKELTH